MPPVYYYSAAGRRFVDDIYDGLADIRAGFGSYSLWAYLGWRDFVASTKRTLLGSVWTIVTYLLKVACLGYIYARVLNDDPRLMFAYVAAGLALWDFIATVVTGGLSAFLSHPALIKERADPLSGIALRTLVKAVLQLGYRMIGYVVIAVVLKMPLTFAHFLVLPGLAVYLLVSFPLLLMLGSLGARYRDLGEIIQPIMLLLFLISPVLWHSGHLGAESWIGHYNPLSHVLEIVREPMLGRPPSMTSVIWVSGLLATSWVLAIGVFGRAKNSIVFWV